jgi:hypothetical protein
MNSDRKSLATIQLQLLHGIYPLEPTSFMSNTNLWESARQGDLKAISELVRIAFEGEDITIETELQLGVTLWFKLSSQKVLDPKVCTITITQTLNEIQLKKITSVRISYIIPSITGINCKWNKYLALKNGKFEDNTSKVLTISYGITSVFAVILTLILIGWVPLTKLYQTNQDFERKKIRQFIVDNITTKYGYEPSVITWGDELVLTVPAPAWNNLSKSERETLIDYAKAQHAKRIIVGRVKSSNTITIDNTVACFDEKLLSLCLID